MSNTNNSALKNQPVADKVAPHSTDAEEAMLGACLINPDGMAMVRGYVSVEDFYLVKHMWIWQAMLALADAGDDIDNVTVIRKLEEMGRLEQTGGSAYITYLLNNTPTHIHANTYARIVEAAAVRRRVLAVCGDIATMAVQGGLELVPMLSKANLLLAEASRLKQNGDFKFLSQIVEGLSEEIEARHNGDAQPLGIPTGLTLLDKMLAHGGYNKSELVLIAARPGFGKTALAVGSGVHAAKQGAHVAIMSKEMTSEQLNLRMLAAETGINSNLLLSGDLDDEQWGRYMEAVSRLSALPIAIDDSPTKDINALCEKARRLHREWGIDLLIVDYIQLLCNDESRNQQNRNLEISTISRKLKELAMELNIPVIALSQLTRDVEDRKTHIPQLADLRDSGSLEQDADTVLFIYRDEMYDDNSEHKGEADLLMAKQRHGIAPQKETVGWIGNVTRFIDLRKDHSVTDYANVFNGGSTGSGAASTAALPANTNSIANQEFHLEGF